MFFLRPTPWVKQHSKDSMVTTFKDTVKLFLTRDMLMFSFTLFYTGLHQTLWGGVYSTSIGFTKGFVHILHLNVLHIVILIDFDGKERH